METSAFDYLDHPLERLSGAQYFSVLDMVSGYFQIPLDPKDKEKTAFTGPMGGAYQFTVMPFGLTNAPSTFQRHMDLVLSGLNWSQSIVYIDDIIIYSESFEKHIKDLQQVFNKVRKGFLIL